MMIKRFLTVGLSLLLGLSVIAPTRADPGHWDGWGWGLGLGFGLGLLYSRPYYSPYYYPYYPPNYYYYPAPTVIVNQPPAWSPGTTVVVPDAAPAAAWYYCEPAQGYYPYVRQCPEAWLPVPAVPPGMPSQ
ncbi:MAG: hypothetical protein KGI82_01705 [Betaproteobacteria bacterium]|nr:hypothetical protein [Betaproteobacteria bacterium]